MTSGDMREDGATTAIRRMALLTDTARMAAPSELFQSVALRLLPLRPPHRFGQ